MKYRTLGKTNLKVSVIGMGTWQFGGEWGKNFAQDEVDGMFAAAKETGINLIDTAECYGDHLSESLIGKATQHNRKDWIIATKCGHKFHGYMNRTDPRSPRDVEQQLDESLKALRTDYIDIYQYHSWGDDQFFDQDVQAVLEKAKQSGKVRHLGNSVRAKGDSQKQIDASTSKQIEVIQIVYNRLERSPEQGPLQSCSKQNLGVLARVPLASGFLSGRYKPGATFASNDFRDSKSREEIDAKLREVEHIAKSEVPTGVNMARWALAWCLKNSTVSSVIPGCKSVDQVKQNASAADLL